MHTSKLGMTLVETLVVIAILIGLLALLFPIFLSGRRRATETTCLSNLQQINHAISLYLADNDGVYPPASATLFINHETEGEITWPNLVQPYLKGAELPRCPDVETPGKLRWFSSHVATCGYAVNDRLNGELGTSQRYLMQGRSDVVLAYPSMVIVVFDARAGITSRKSPDLGKTATSLDGIYRANFVQDILAQTEGAIRHHGGANYAFADGHVAWLRPTQICTDRHSDGLHPGFGL